MPFSSARLSARDQRDSFTEDLQSMRVDGRDILVQLLARRDDDGVWRGRLQFTDADAEQSAATAEICRGESEHELWQSVRGLGEHHVRDLYRSLV